MRTWHFCEHRSKLAEQLHSRVSPKVVSLDTGTATLDQNYEQDNKQNASNNADKGDTVHNEFSSFP